MMDLRTITYIQSETEFNRAKGKGFWEVMVSLVTRRRPYLVPLDEVIKTIPLEQMVYAGLRDIALKDIVGSAGRHRDYTPHFWPCVSDERSKERWRSIYTLAVSGAGFPPIEVYQMGSVYFVQNGHHRVSVARHLGWSTIQAYVTVISHQNCAYSWQKGLTYEQ